MLRSPRSAVLATLAALCLLVPAGAAAKGPVEVITPISAKVLAPPTPVLGTDGRRHLVYELQLLNWTAKPDALESISVRAGGSGRTLASYAGAALSPLLIQQPFGLPEPADHVLAPGQSTILWFDVVLPRRGKTPTSLVHHVVVNGIKAPIGRTHVGRAPVVISPPLRGKLFVDGNGCCGATPHVRAIQTLDGVRWLSQRYAIDFLQANRQGRTYAGNAHKAANYFVFDEPVHSVAPGVVTSVLDSRPTEIPPVPDTSLDNYNAARFVTGNHVIVRIRPHVYAMYAHLKLGTIKVEAGERVRRGQVLARAGNSGNTTAPHLHFQLTSRNSPLASNGVPYVFDDFTLEGRISGPLLDFVESGIGTIARDRSSRTRQLPLSATVLSFP